MFSQSLSSGFQAGNSRPLSSSTPSANTSPFAAASSTPTGSNSVQTTKPDSKTLIDDVRAYLHLEDNPDGNEYAREFIRINKLTTENFDRNATNAHYTHHGLRVVYMVMYAEMRPNTMMDLLSVNIACPDHTLILDVVTQYDAANSSLPGLSRLLKLIQKNVVYDFQHAVCASVSPSISNILDNVVVPMKLCKKNITISGNGVV